MQTQTQQASSVGFIGLGAMGLGMARQLLQKGYQVTGFDVRQEALAAFSAAGGKTAQRPDMTAQGAAVLVVMVVDAGQAESVLFGEQGAVKALPHGAVVVLSSTVAASFARSLGERLEASGHLLLDAPVSGGVGRAQSGELTIMASGTPAAFARAQNVLDAMSAKVYRLGDAPGMGSSVKTVNQLLAGVHIVAAAEAMALGTRAGLDPRLLFDVISNSAGSSWMFNNRVPHMLDGDYTPLSAVEIFVKDLGLVLDTGRELRFPLPLAAAAHQLFLMASAAGFGKLDDAAVVKVWEQLAQVSVSRPSRDSKQDAK